MLQLLTMVNMDHGHYMRFWNRGHALYAGSTAGYGAGSRVHPQQACSGGLVGEGVQLEGGAGEHIAVLYFLLIWVWESQKINAKTQ